MTERRFPISWKLLGPILVVLLLAGWMFAENVQSHPGAKAQDLAMYALFSLAYGALYMGVTVAIFAPLAWLARRLRRRKTEPPRSAIDAEG